MAVLGYAAAAQQPTPQPAKTCAGTKADGTPCRLKVAGDKTYCHHHDPATPRCGFPKASGEPCRMPVKAAGDRCHHHKSK